MNPCMVAIQVMILPFQHLYYQFSHSTLQTFNSCTSRPDVYQCTVVQTPIDNVKQNKPRTLMTHVACELKLRSILCIDSLETWWHSGVRSCVMPGLSTHFVQELNINTVTICDVNKFLNPISRHFGDTQCCGW